MSRVPLPDLKKAKEIVMKSVVVTTPKKKPSLYEAMKAAGLEGCIAGPGDLAKNHSKYLKGKPRAPKKAAA